MRWALLVVALAPAAAGGEAAQVMTLAEALQIARVHQPQLLEARASTRQAEAAAGVAAAPLLPQVQADAAYTRSTANFSARPGLLPGAVSSGGVAPSWSSFDYLSSQIGATQLLYDFGGTFDRWRSARASAEAQGETERATLLQILLGVRTAFFTASADHALVRVAQETLDNQTRHLRQIEGFVEVGTQPRIALAQGRTAVANAQVQLITAENAYATSKVQLNQAVGIDRPTDYEVAEESLSPVDVEDGEGEVLQAEALRARPEFASIDRQIRAAELTVSAVHGAYGPSLGVSTGFTDSGEKLQDLVWNWSAGVTLTWPLFQGGLTWFQGAQVEAQLDGLKATREVLLQQVKVQVEQARLGVRATRSSVAAAGEALVNAQEQLRLAEGRYQTGAGSIIELGDSQVALTTAAVQKVQADFQLSSARAQLLQALGRP